MSKLDLSTLSADELQAELERRKSSEKKAAEERRKQYEQHKNNFVNNTASRFQELHKELSQLKKDAILGSNKMYERMYEINGKEPKETRSFTLKNTEDTVKVVVERPERFEFTEEATVHINTIKDIFKEKFEGRNKKFYNFLNSVLIRGKKGEYDPKLLAKSKKEAREIGDEDLIKEFDKLDECQRVTGISSYCRVYVRSEQGKYQDISLQFSSL